jgi:hypothetical protein
MPDHVHMDAGVAGMGRSSHGQRPSRLALGGRDPPHTDSGTPVYSTSDLRRDLDFPQLVADALVDGRCRRQNLARDCGIVGVRLEIRYARSRRPELQN